MDKVIYRTFKAKGLSGVLRLGLEYTTLKLWLTRLLYLPSSIQVEPTIRCNLKCTMCDQPVWGRTAPDMSIEDFKMITDQFNYLRNITIQGLGEPTLNPSLPAMVRYAKFEKKIQNVGLITNGTLLTESVARSLLDAGLDRMGVSIDSPIPQEYASIRVGAKLDIVLKNLKRFAEINSSDYGDQVALNVGMVCTLNNLESASALMDIVYEAGVRSFGIKSAHVWGKDYMDEKMRVIRLKNDVAKVKRVISALQKKAKRYNMNFRYDHFNDLLQQNIERYNMKFGYSLLNEKKRSFYASGCIWPWVSTYITVDGFVTPCSLHGTDPRKFNFGNLHEKPFKEIWNSPAYREFRRKLRSPNPDAFCKGCPEL